MRGVTGSARGWVAAILIAGWALCLFLCWPGELSYDSIVQLHDGRVGFYHTWHPPVMAWLLGLADAVVPGAAVFVVFNSALFFGAMLLLVWMRLRVAASAVVAATLVLLPQCLLYQGIVWKDVLFANCAVASFVCLAVADARWERRRIRLSFLAAATVLSVLAALTRQNGAIVSLVALVSLFVIARRKGGARDAALHSAGAFLLATVLLVFATVSLDSRSDHGEGPAAQLQLLRIYDLSGALAADPSLNLSLVRAQDPELERLLRSDGARLYTPERNDALSDSQALQDAVSAAPAGIVAAQWMELVRARPLLYLRVRLNDFAQLFLTPTADACRAVYTGVDGPAPEMADLGIAPRRNPRDAALSRYAQAFVGTPAMSHITYAVLGLAAFAFLLRRRATGDIAMAGLLMAAGLFAASFFVISIACDYRYLYFLDAAALAALFHIALDYGLVVSAMRSGSFWLLRSAERKS